MSKIKKSNKKSKKVFTIIMAITLSIISIIIANGISLFKSVQAATGYTVINSETLFDKSTLDTLKLNITSLPEVTVEGSKNYTLKDEEGKRKVIYENVSDGESIDSTITTIFKNCGTLNNRKVDLKIVYSGIVAGKSTENVNKAVLHWTAYGVEENQISSNEWWYGGIEKVDAEINFYYHGESNPINLERAYLSIYSQDKGEAISAKEAEENYLYSNTTIQYHQGDYTTENVKHSYNNLFVGTADDWTEGGNKEKVGFRYKNKTSLKLTLYSFSTLKNVGYHFRFTPLTGVVPDAPTKTVNKQEAKAGEELVYEAKQELLKGYDEKFNYTDISFTDKLDSSLEFKSFKIVFSTGDQIEQSQMVGQGNNNMGNFEFNSETNQVTWKAGNAEENISAIPLQMVQKAKGGWMKFIITARIKATKTEGTITNKASVKIQNQYNLESNTVTTNIEKEPVKTGKIIVHYVDKISNAELAKETKEGNVGEKLTTTEKQFEKYTLVQKPTTENYTFEENEQDVYYYYIYNTNIRVHHIYGTNGGEDIEESTGSEGENYTTHPKDNPVGHDNKKYKLDESKLPENAEGTLTKETVDVKYYYIPEAGNVTVKHLDKVTKEQIAEPEIIEGWAGESYTTHPVENPYYILEETPQNASGTLTEETQEVIYYYLRKSTVIVNHLDVVTKEILKTEQMQGVETKEYITQEQEFDGYDLCIDKYPENSKGLFEREPIIVNYYYIYKSNVTVEHIDKTTGKQFEEEKIEGHEGDKFTTEPKQKDFYKLVEEPKSRNGTLTKEPQEVIYYYEPLLFNVKVEQIIDKIVLNNEETLVGGTLGKTEVNRKLTQYDLKIYYTIKVTNNMELTGNTLLTDYIPDGFMANVEENPNWKIDKNLATIWVENINPGETREYTINL